MVIGFDGSRAFSENKTGTENYSYQLLKALAKIDKKNSYIVYVRPYSVILNEAKRSEGSLTNVSSNKLRDSSLTAQNDNYRWPENFTFKYISWPRFWTQGGLALETFKQNLDVLFVPSHTLPIIRKPGLKTVITVHDLGSEYLPSMHQLKQKVYLFIMQKHQLKTATKIIAVSNATKEDLVNRLKINGKKIEVVYEGYDEHKFKMQNSKVKIDDEVNSLKQYDIEKGRYFLFVGTVQPRKNLARLIKAFAKFSSKYKVVSSKDRANNKNHTTNYQLPTTDFHLVIAGSKGWLSDEIYKLPKQLGIEDRVKFLGYVPDSDLPTLYRGARAFLFPSLFEGFGLPILEAQACGCPVITSNISSMPEVAGLSAGGGAILVDPYNIDDIVKGMKVVESRESRVELIKTGLENIKRFSWEKCAKETLEVLEDVSSR